MRSVCTKFAGLWSISTNDSMTCWMTWRRLCIMRRESGLQRRRAAFRRGKANIKEQVGILRRVVVMDCGDGLIEAINPVIISTSGEQGDLEGCLSFPGKSGYVVRPNHVVMRAYDRDGSLIEYEAEGLLARCIMHECDHLDGHVYLEKVTEPPEGFDAGQAEEQE